MCIKEVSSYEWAGKLYKTKREAVEMAPREIGDQIQVSAKADILTTLNRVGSDLCDLICDYRTILAEATEDITAIAPTGLESATVMPPAGSREPPIDPAKELEAARIEEDLGIRPLGHAAAVKAGLGVKL